jgi:hypothetical protein
VTDRFEDIVVAVERILLTAKPDDVREAVLAATEEDFVLLGDGLASRGYARELMYVRGIRVERGATSTTLLLGSKHVEIP